MTNSYQVIFCGQALSGFTLKQVKANVAKLYNTDVNSIQSLFKGTAVVIKDKLDEATAHKYADVFRKQGAQCEVKNKAMAAANGAQNVSDDNKSDASAAKEQVQQAVVHSAHNSSSEMVQAQRVSAAAKCSVVLDDYIGSMADISVADRGATMVEFNVVDMPDINTSSLEMAVAGETLVDFKKVEAPNIAIESLSLAPTGTDLKD